MVEVVALSNVSDKVPTQNIPFSLQHVPCFFQTSDTLTEIPQRTLWATSLPSNKGGWSPLCTGTIALSTFQCRRLVPTVHRHHCPFYCPLTEQETSCAQVPLPSLPSSDQGRSPRTDTISSTVLCSIHSSSWLAPSSPAFHGQRILGYLNRCFLEGFIQKTNV